MAHNAEGFLPSERRKINSNFTTLFGHLNAGRWNRARVKLNSMGQDPLIFRLHQSNAGVRRILNTIHHTLGPQPPSGGPSPFTGISAASLVANLQNYRGRVSGLRSFMAAPLRQAAVQRGIYRTFRRGVRHGIQRVRERRAAATLEAARAAARAAANETERRNAARRARAEANAANANAANEARRREANKVHAIGLRLAAGHLLARSNFVSLQRNLNAINTALLSANKRANYNRFAAVILEELAAGANQPNISNPKRNLLNTVRRLSQTNQRAARLAARRYDRLYHNLPANLRHLL